MSARSRVCVNRYMLRWIHRGSPGQVRPLRSERFPHKLLLGVFPLHVWRVLTFEVKMAIVRLGFREKEKRNNVRSIILAPSALIV